MTSRYTAESRRLVVRAPSATLALALSLAGLLACSSLSIEIPSESTVPSETSGAASATTGTPTAPTSAAGTTPSEGTPTEETPTGGTPSVDSSLTVDPSLPAESTPSAEGTPSAEPTPSPETTPPPPTHTIGGTIVNLRGEGLVLSLNDGEQVTALGAGSEFFTFPEPLEAGSSYIVQVDTEPSKSAETCTVEAGTGEDLDGDVDDIRVVCQWRTLRQACETNMNCASGGARCPDLGTRRCAPNVPFTTGTYEFNYVSGNAFLIGSPQGEIGREPPQTGLEDRSSVELTRDFYLGRYPLRQVDWLFLAGDIPDSLPDCPQCPVARMTWWSAIWLANRVSEREGLPPCYDLSDLPCSDNMDEAGAKGFLDCGDENMPRVLAPAGDVYACVGYRLPTEAEWEYAMRAGTQTATWAGDLTSTSTDCASDDHAVLTNAKIIYCGNADTIQVGESTLRVPSPVFETGFNSWGFFSALGNVFNWTWDVFNDATPTGVDPVFESAGPDARARVVRGGSFDSNAFYARSAARFRATSTSRDRAVGLRLARSAF